MEQVAHNKRTVIIEAPFGPQNLPKKLAEIKLIKGKKINVKYIRTLGQKDLNL